MVSALYIKPAKKKKHPFRFKPRVLANRIHTALNNDLLGGFTTPKLESLQMYKGLSHELIWRQRMCNDLLKKFVNEEIIGQETPQRTAAYKKFKANVERLENFDPCLPSWTGGSWSFSRPTKRDIILARARNFIHNMLRGFSIEDWFYHCKHSSGTTIGLSFELTNLDDKNRFPMTATKAQKEIFIQYLAWDTNLRDAIFANSDPIWSTLYNLSGWDELFIVEESSVGTTVPKNAEIDRFICKETTVGMFLQKGLESWFYSAIQASCEALGIRFWADTETLQDIHRQLAQLFSLTGEGATVDWSNASDNFLRAVVKFFVPLNVYSALVIVGAKSMTFKLNELEEVTFDLPMISTMGNATTFPLETALFFAVALSTVSYHHDHSTSVCPDWALYMQSVSVFGDDCILPSGFVTDFVEVMESLGHQVNINKSYIDPDVRFRESCGGDYYDYRDVRPFHLTWPTTSTSKNALEAWLYVICNRLLKKFKTNFGSLTYIYRPTFQTLANLFNEYRLIVKLVPDDYPDDAGLKLGHDEVCRGHFNVCTFQLGYTDVTSGASIFPSLRWVYINEKDDPTKNNTYYPLLLKNAACHPDSLTNSFDFENVSMSTWKQRLAVQEIKADVPQKYTRKKVGRYVVYWSVRWIPWLTYKVTRDMNPMDKQKLLCFKFKMNVPYLVERQ